MSERAAPFYCPYCGDEHLEPYEGDGTWYCRDCVRAFRLKFLGVGAAGRPMSAPGASSGSDASGGSADSGAPAAPFSSETDGPSMTGKTTTSDLPDRTETQ